MPLIKNLGLNFCLRLAITLELEKVSGKRMEYAVVWEQEKEVDCCFAEMWNLKGEWKDRFERMAERRD